jgi:hypothetical protein
MVLENRVLRIIFGPKRGKVRGEWRKLHNEELYDLYFSSNIIQIKNTWAGHVAHMRRQEKCMENLVGKPQGQNYLKILGVDGVIILNGFSRRGLGEEWTGLISVRIEADGGPF